MKLPKDQRIDLRQHIKENPDQKLWEPFCSITDDGNYLIAAYCQPSGKSLNSVWILYKDPNLRVPKHPILLLNDHIHSKDPSVSSEFLHQNSMSHDYWKHVEVFTRLRSLLSLETDISHLIPALGTCAVCKFFEALEKLSYLKDVIIFSTSVDIALVPENILSILDSVLESKSQHEEGTNIETFCSLQVTLPPYYTNNNDLLASLDTNEERELFLKKYIGPKASLVPLIPD